MRSAAIPDKDSSQHPADHSIASFAYPKPRYRVPWEIVRRFVALWLFRTAGAILPIVLALTSGTAQAQNSCNVGLTLTPDYQFAIGTSTGGTGYAFTLNGTTVSSGATTQLALFHYDGSLDSTSGVSASVGANVAYTTAEFGQGMYVQSGVGPTYPGSLFNPFEGTVEMWIAPRSNGNGAIFANTGYSLFQYTAGNGDYFAVGFDGQHTGRIVFTGANVNGQWESAYSGAADISTWKAGEWHHVAATFSASSNHIRFYLDGVKVADNNEGHYYPPSASGGSVRIGTTAFAVDEVRISSVALPDATIAYNAGRSAPFANNEVLLPLANVSPGQITYSVNGCGSTSYSFGGIPITNLSPPSGLLSPSGTSIVFNTIQPTTCRYSIGSALDYAFMQPFDTGPATTAHSGVLSGLSPDPRVLNKVYLRCASDPGFAQSLTYRVVAAPNGSFPRIGSIWLGEYLNQNRPDLAKKIQLFFGPNGMTAAEANTLRASNPDVLILPAIQVDDDFSLTLPETYYLHDVHGNRVSDWCAPLSYVYNMTRPEVADYVAQQAYQALAQSNWAFDGVFFDSFATSYPATLVDCHGNSVQIDANGDGQPDNQAQLNAAWATGMYRVVSTFRSLAPGAYIAGHVLEQPAQATSLAAFNGTSIEFYQQNVREGRASFSALQDLYASWESGAVSPAITMMQSAPPNQVAYGYGYYPLQTIPSALATFAQTFYSNMRFGLALTLMGDGYFTHDFGDLAPNAPTAWWYDEYDFDLGLPLGPATLIGSGASANLLTNGGFESGLQPWTVAIVNDGQASATVTIDSSTASEGLSSARIAVARPGTANWHIGLIQPALSLTGASLYQLQFWARADSTRTIAVQAQSGPPNLPVNGLDRSFQVDSSWKLYSASFAAPVSASDARIQFFFGEAGTYWVDGVTLIVPPRQVYRRDFTKGVVLLNGDKDAQTIALESGFRRFEGAQAPRYQYIIDDAGTAFTTTGAWSTACSTADVRAWVLNPPYYHAWAGTCHQLDSAVGNAQWSLAIPADGRYTIQAWLPAAPNAAGWTKNAIYEVVSSGNVISTGVLDQSAAIAGDQWHTVATVDLSVAGAPTLRLRNGGSGPLIADAIYVTSSALFNDGSSTTSVTLGPFDGILLKRDSADNELRDVVEYYNAALDHYFITWVTAEQANLDAGNTPTKWNRTGYSFKTHTVAQAGTSPVCRYYIPPTKGDSHFFGRGTVECDATGQKNPTFVLEDSDFMNMFLPMDGVCPIGTISVYRVFDNRPDANHRYMTDKTVRDAMVGKGWVAEGDGPDLVVMCAPQ